MDSSNFRLVLHAARLAIDESLNYVSPFKWTAEQRAALTAYGRANGNSEAQIKSDLDRAERDEETHKAFVDVIDEADDLEAALDREMSFADLD